MSIYKRGNTWQAMVYWKGKRQIIKGGFKTKKKAKLWHDKTLALIEINKGDEIHQKAATFKELITKYCQTHIPTIRKSSASRYLSFINLRILPEFEHYKLEKINQEMIENFKASLIRDLSPKSTNNCIALLKSILKKGAEWQMIDRDPSTGVKLLKIPRRKYLWWEQEEDVIRFVEYARRDTYHLVYRLGLDLGMRIGEIIGLNIEDIRLDLGQIHIHRQWIQREKRLGPTKHGKERYLRFDINSELGQLLKIQCASKKSDTPLFTYETGRRINPQKVSQIHFRKVIKLANVPRIRFHDLRHTFASWYMIKNDNIWELMKLLGHSDIQTTMKYAHLSSFNKIVPAFDWSNL